MEAPVICKEEQLAIAKYKEYQKKHLPNARNIEGLYAPDFDNDAYTTPPAIQVGNAIPNETRENLSAVVDNLALYLIELREYTKCIVRAAKLRQSHYETYIAGKIDEESRHKKWREGMNAIADDCTRKCEYWTKVYDSKLDCIIELTSNTQNTPNIDFTARNCDYFYLDDTEVVKTRTEVVKTRTEVVKPPRISAKERKRLRAEYARQLFSIRREEFAMLDKEAEKHKYYNDLIESYSVYRADKCVLVPARDMYDMLTLAGFDDPMVCDFAALNFDKSIRLVGSDDDMRDLALLTYNAVAMVQLEYCKYYQCDLGDYDASELPNVICGTSHVSRMYGVCNHKCGRNAGTDAVGNPTLTPSTHISLKSIDAKVHFIIPVIKFISQIGNYINIAGPIILNCIIIDHRANWGSYPIVQLMTAVVGEMSDETFILNYLGAIEKIKSIREQIDILRKMDYPTDVLAEALRILMSHLMRINVYANKLANMYPGALYVDRLQFMLQMINSDDVLYGSKVVKDDRQWVSPPCVNYALIKRRTGLTLKIRPPLLAQYNRVYAEYRARLKSVLSEMNKK